MDSQTLSLPEIGDLIGGRFRILEILGTGGFGTVYRAMQENIGRDVALKFLTPIIAKDPINVERFRREAYHVSQLRHPNTITLFDYGQTEDGLAYMVMELLNGDSLADVIQNEGAMDWPRVAHIYIQVLKSITEAHRRGLVHRDLKPENIFLCEMFGELDYVKVLDFGVAKMTLADSGDGDEGEEQLTKAGRIFGTPMYMSPEQACAEPITPATDVYALGLLLFEMSTGLPPVTGRNRMDVIHKQIRDQVPELTADLINSPMGRLIQKCCQKTPSARYPDATALLEGFIQAVQQSAIYPAPMGGSRPDLAVAYMMPAEPAPLREAPAVAPLFEASSPILTSAPELDTGERARKAAPPPLPDKVRSNPSGAQTALPREANGPVRRQPSLEDRSHSRPRYELPLIGREPEFAQIYTLMEDTAHMGTGHFLLLEGEGGLGKTHLLQGVLAKVRERDIATSQANFRRRSLPMEALREVIAGLWGVAHSERMQVDTIVRQDLKDLGGFSDGEITFYVEFLRPRAPEDSEIASSEAGALYARLERLMLRLAERRPLVLVLEDLQYADSASLAFLEYFAVTLRTHAVPVLVMLSLRPEERSLNPDLEHSLRTISANVGVGFTRLRLRRLRGRDLAFLLDSIVPLEARIKERIGWLSQGVPLHAMQIIRYLQNENNLVRKGDRWGLKNGTPRKINLPPDLMDLMTLRIEQAITKHAHRPKLRSVLQWIAILGMRAPMELLASVVQQNEHIELASLEQDLSALTDEGIVRQALHQNVICVEFDNSLLREAILTELADQWASRRLHRAAAEQKVAFYRHRQLEVPLVEIADHWRQAGDTDKYRDTLYSASRRSMARFDLRGARDQYRELINLLEERNERAEMWTDAQLALAELARRFGEFGVAEDHYRRIVEQGVAQGREKGRALRGFAHLLTVQCRYNEALQYYSLALDWSQQIKDGPGVAKALIGLSRVHLMQGDARAGEAVRKRLEEMATNLPEGEVSGKVLLHLAEAAQRRGQLTKRYDYLVRARLAFQASNDRQGLSDALIALGGALMGPAMNAPDRFQQAEKTLREALELKRSIGDRHGVAEAFRHLGQMELERNNHDTAETLLTQSLNIHQALGAPFNIGATQNALGVLHIHRRHYERADAHFDQAIDIFKRMGDEIACSQPLLNKGIAAINMRNVAQAQTCLREARRIKESFGSSWALFDLRNHLALVAMWLGEFDQAERLLDETLEQVDAHGTGEDRAVARSLLGLLRCFQSRLQMAALELGRARADAEDLNMGSVTLFCQANAAFYACLTESATTFENLLKAIEPAEMLNSIDRDIWLELLENMAIHTVHREKNRQSTRLLRAVATFWQRFGQVQRGDALARQAKELDAELSLTRH
ncbi:MAG: protein kinase [Bradymonadaceae bacterium]|nr:protein kinase [Lujinxingiaceae bacterium]